MQTKRAGTLMSIITLAGSRGGVFLDRIDFYNKIITTPSHKHFVIDKKTIHAYLVDIPGEVIVSEATICEFNNASRGMQNDLLLKGWAYVNQGYRGRRTYSDDPISMREVIRGTLLWMEERVKNDYIASKTPEGMKS